MKRTMAYLKNNYIKFSILLIFLFLIIFIFPVSTYSASTRDIFENCAESFGLDDPWHPEKTFMSGDDPVEYYITYFNILDCFRSSQTNTNNYYAWIPTSWFHWSSVASLSRTAGMPYTDAHPDSPITTWVSQCEFDKVGLCEEKNYECDHQCNIAGKLSSDPCYKNCDIEKAQCTNAANILCEGEMKKYVMEWARQEKAMIIKYASEENDGNANLPPPIDIEGINLNVSIVSGQPSPPLNADGEVATKFNISATYKTDKSKRPELEFKLRDPGSRKPGTITSVSKNNLGGYIVSYQTPALEEITSGRPSDWLYIYYKTYDGSDTKYVTYEIDLYTGRTSDIHITHPGFKPYVGEITLDANEVEVFVYTVDNSNQFPVENAEIKYESFFPERTNKYGQATLKAKSEVYGKESSSQEFELVLSDKVTSQLKQAERHYAEIKKTNNNINDFLDGYAAYLGTTATDGEAEGLVNMLYSLNHSLFILNHGADFSEHISKRVGDTLGDLIWDSVSFAMDLSDVLAMTQKKMRQQEANLLAGWDADDFEFAQEKMNQYFRMVMKKLYKKLSGKIYRKTGANPKAFTKITDTIINDLMKKDVKAIFNLIDIKKTITKAYQDEHDVLVNEIMQQIGKRVKKREFSRYDYITESRSGVVRIKYESFVGSFESAASFEYSTSEYRAWSDIFRNSVLKGLDIVYGHTTLGKIADGVSKVLGGVDVALNAVKYSDWLTQYEQNQRLIRENISSLMEIDLAYADNFEDKYYVFSEIAYAADEQDELDILFENNVPLDHPDRAKVLDYYDHQQDHDIYQASLELMDLVAPFAKDDEEFQQIYQEINTKYSDLHLIIEQEKENIKNLDILKPKKKKTNWDEYEWKKWLGYIVGFIFFVSIICWWRKRKKTKKQSKLNEATKIKDKIQEKVKPKRSIFVRILKGVFRLIVIVIILVVVGAIAIFFYQDSGNQDFVNQNSSNQNYGSTGGGSVDASITASSTLPPAEGYIYDASMAADGSNHTAWVEGADGIGDYEWIQFIFSKKQEISQMSIVPGYASTNSSYFKNNRVKEFRLEFSDGSKVPFSLSDEMTTHSIMFDPVNTEYVRIVILDVYRGSEHNDTAIAEVSFK